MKGLYGNKRNTILWTVEIAPVGMLEVSAARQDYADDDDGNVARFFPPFFLNGGAHVCKIRLDGLDDECLSAVTQAGQR